MNNQLTTQQQQPTLIASVLLNMQFIHGIYRLAGCLLLLDKKQRPYWKMQFSDLHGTICMYMFTPPSGLEELGHGAFVEVKGAVKNHGKQRYIEITELNKTDQQELSSQVALSNLPETYCVPNQNLSRLNGVLSKIDSQPLQKFMADVLVPLDVCIPFFQAPASLNHHHNYPGGLLEHSLEVAEIVADLPLKTQVETELSIVGALLHDIGKIKSLDGRMIRLETGKWVDHSALTLEICANGLANLEKNNSLFANILRHTWACATPGARYGYKANSPVAEAVMLADGFSAKNT